jgi:predicted metalloenzyme YecM
MLIETYDNIKKLLILFLFWFFFIGTASAEGLSWSSFFFPKIEKFNNCVEVLKKENIDNSQLCIDKYAKAIKNTKIAKTSDLGANKYGEIVMDIENISSEFIIKKVQISGIFECKDITKCNYFKSFNITRYISIPPGQKYPVHFWEPNKIEFPEDVKSGEWTWSLHSKQYFGFKVEY